MRTLRGDTPLLEDDDLVGKRDRREPVGDDECRAAAGELIQSAGDAALRGGVDAGGGVVEDQDARVLEQRPRDRDALALPTRKRVASLADSRVIALRQVVDELLGARAPGRVEYLLVRCLRTRVGDVVAHAGGE